MALSIYIWRERERVLTKIHTVYACLVLFYREMQMISKVRSTSYQSWINIGDSGFKAIVFLCSVVVLVSVYVIFTKPRFLQSSKRGSPSLSTKPVSKTPNYPTDFRISL